MATLNVKNFPNKLYERLKSLAMAERRWRRINAPQLAPLVRAGAVFRDDVLVERRGQARRAA